MSSGPLFTVFIPTYNRAHTLSHALDSVAQQSLQDYEILVIDDGSSDATRSVVESWEISTGISVRYYYQDNGGKHRAHNRALELATGQLLMVLDSDDVMLKDCLEVVRSAWLSIPPSLRAEFAGVEGLCVTSSGRLHGSAFPQDPLDCTYLEAMGVHHVTGEKRNAIRIEVLREFPYPAFPGENHVRPSFIWKRISHRYKMRFINKRLHVVDFGADGLTINASVRRLRNPHGLYAYWRDDLLYHQSYLRRRRRRKHYSEYIRYALHAGVGLLEQWKEVPDRLLWLSALSRALPNFLADRYKTIRHKR